MSVRELVRRAGFQEKKRAAVAYHLNPNKHDGTRSHQVPPEIVRGLASVLPVSEDELADAARVAAGFTVVDERGPDVTAVLQRFYGDDDVSDEEKRAVTARVLQIIAEQQAAPPSHNRNATPQ